MALERKTLRAILEDETTDTSGKLKKILDVLHEETDTLQNQLDEKNAALAKAEKDRDAANGGKEAAEKALTDYKAQQTAAASKAAKTAAFKQLLKQAGVLEKYIDDIADDSKKGDEFAAGLELDADGKVKDAEKQLSSIKTTWGGKIATTKTTGAKVDTPPTNTGSKMTKDQIFAIKDADERQAAIAANADLFTGGGKE
jgi:predicted  nucleic acid-binding Zn-ribbon protein